jgi:hypothetical protein
MQATQEKRRQALQEVWDRGNGVRFMFSAFGDLTTCKEANLEARNFIRGKIAVLKPQYLYLLLPLIQLF